MANGPLNERSRETGVTASLKCTRVVVAHRLSTIKLADRIVMLDGGRIVEEGTYDELVEADGVFADLVRRQQLEGA